ncbi:MULTISPECIES: FAD-dependent monooxygenase [Paenibacillus]|uniref:2-polyprenyl-6-methoxyphenol hydroxylase-like FAD-dependent oxidoreductase n=1 Tax=Paenibacillus peoriae TaxID=59893 RepID=A0ABU1QKD0_9BACL|nr:MULTISPECIES: FAD-dependent monooxygenase [Paenibacillus]MCP3746976.1 FAD-dependent monooxygenase [Paenibacillus sp. A3M_27_13]MDR6780033.1 2-polyprenyl-6-methoxyphenol hydroxylase-like FAD-dependent oxidoreductase [Paenibacillus peoriae]
MKLECEVCVVGGGPAGTLLSCLLAAQGVSTILIERQSIAGKAFRGEILNDEGQEVIQKHKLLEQIHKDYVLASTRIEYWEHQQQVKTVKPASVDGNVGVHIPQPRFLEALLKQASTYESFRYLAGTTVTTLEGKSEQGYTGLAARDKNGHEITIDSSLIVGADGRYSTVRKLAQMPVTNIRHGYDLLWAKITAPAGWEPVTRLARVNGGQLALFSQAEGYIQIGWNVEEGSFPTLFKQSFEPFIQRLTEAFPDLKHSVHDHIRSWKDFVPLDIFSSRSDTWAQNGLVLIGDAAHTMTPTGAFGLNAALKDADVLASELLRLRQKSYTAGDLKAFEDGRRQAVTELQERQLTMESTFHEHFLQADNQRI